MRVSISDKTQGVENIYIKSNGSDASSKEANAPVMSPRNRRQTNHGNKKQLLGLMN